MILPQLSRLLTANNREASRRVVLVSLKRFGLWTRREIPFQKQHRQEKLELTLLLRKNRLFRNIEYRCFVLRPGEKYFQLIEEKDIKTVSILPSFDFLCGMLKLKIMDKDFSLSEFKDNSQEALHIVINKMVQDEFSDLDELFTPECLSEVKNNVGKLNPEQKNLFLLNKEHLLKNGICHIGVDSNLSSEGAQSGEKIATIVLVCLNVIKVDNNKGGFRFFAKTYNTEFRRSYKDNMKGHWVISDMNMLCMLFDM